MNVSQTFETDASRLRIVGNRKVFEFKDPNTGEWYERDILINFWELRHVHSHVLNYRNGNYPVNFIRTPEKELQFQSEREQVAAAVPCVDCGTFTNYPCTGCNQVLLKTKRYYPTRNRALCTECQNTNQFCHYCTSGKQEPKIPKYAFCPCMCVP